MRFAGKLGLIVILLAGGALLAESIRYISAMRLGPGYAETGLVGMVGVVIALPMVAVPAWYLLRRRRKTEA